MKEIEIRDRKNRLLAIIAKNSHSLKNGMNIFSRKNDIIQAGFLKYEKGYRSKPHYHPQVEQAKISIRQEVMYVIDGTIRLTFYTVEGERVASEYLTSGDLAIIYQGHGVEFIENSLILEIKQGPYLGLEKDKIFLGDKNNGENQ